MFPVVFSFGVNISIYEKLLSYAALNLSNIITFSDLDTDIAHGYCPPRTVINANKNYGQQTTFILSFAYYFSNNSEPFFTK